MRIILKKASVFLSLTCALLLYCIKDFGTLPLQKNLRDLTWTVDTLAYPGDYQTLMDDMWAISSDEVYVVGHNSTSRVMYRFNGERWSNVKLNKSEGGTIPGSKTLHGIYGFGPGDVWAVGDRNGDPLVIHFNGREWREVEVPPGNRLSKVWGSSPDDVWIAGVNGTLFHYDGTSVKKDSVPLSIPEDANPFYTPAGLIGNSAGEVYMLIIDFGSYHYYFLERRGESWVVLDSLFDYSANDLWTIPSGEMFYTGDHVYKWTGDSWARFIDWQECGYSGISGTDENNLIVVGYSSVGGTHGVAFHYNGVGLYRFDELQLPGVIYTEVWTDGEEVFILGVITNKTIIVHGK